MKGISEDVIMLAIQVSTKVFVGAAELQAGGLDIRHPNFVNEILNGAPALRRSCDMYSIMWPI